MDKQKEFLKLLEELKYIGENTEEPDAQLALDRVLKLYKEKIRAYYQANGEESLLVSANDRHNKKMNG